VAVAAFTALVGVLIGTTSAYFGGFFNNSVMRITDAFLAFPVIAGVVLIQQLASITLYNAGIRFYSGGMAGIITATGSFMELPDDLPLLLVVLQKIDPVMIAFILFSWMPYARIMNTMVLRIKQTEYVQAARALGAGHATIIFRHLIPNAIAPVIVLVARDVGGMVLLQATFTFIGLGGNSLWGMLLVRGRDWILGPGGNILTFWWVFMPATLALVLFGVGWNLLGDGLNEVLNPRTR
jgi:peptide/nickel transport system permease protein